MLLKHQLLDYVSEDVDIYNLVPVLLYDSCCIHIQQEWSVFWILCSLSLHLWDIWSIFACSASELVKGHMEVFLRRHVPMDLLKIKSTSVVVLVVGIIGEWWHGRESLAFFPAMESSKWHPAGAVDVSNGIEHRGFWGWELVWPAHSARFTSAWASALVLSIVHSPARSEQHGNNHQDIYYHLHFLFTSLNHYVC